MPPDKPAVPRQGRPCLQKAGIHLKKYGPVIGLGVLIWLVFNQAVRFDFLMWDDNVHIVYNYHLQPPFWAWPKILWIFNFDTSLRFEPGTWLGHLLICSVFTMNPGAYHFCLIVLHFINSVLVYKLCCRVLNRFPESGVPREALAFLASAFWAINAVRAESMGRCTDLSYPLATLWVLSSFGLYLASVDQGRLRPGFYFGSFAFNVLAVCTYPISLGFAFCLPFFDRIFFPSEIAQRQHWRSAGGVTYWLSRMLFILPSLAVGWATIHTRLNPSGSYTPYTASVSPFNLFRLVHGVYAWAYIYLHQFWPFGLTPGHYPWPDPGFHRVYLFAFVCLAGVLALAWRQRSAALLAVLCASVFLAWPMLGLTEEPTTPVDRYTYLPNAFSALLLAWLAGRWWSLLPPRMATRLVLGTAMVGLPLLGLQSHRQLSIWKDSYALFSYLETTPEIKSQPVLQDIIYNLKADQLSLDGDPEAALPIRENLVHREPENCHYWYLLGTVLHSLGNDAEALQALHTAYSLCQDSAVGRLIQTIQGASPPGQAASAAGGAGSPRNIPGHGP
jgi:hypothetical protein